jgi:hypothetical protein
MRRRDDRAPASANVSAPEELCSLFAYRHEDIGGHALVRKLVDVEEAVVEHDVLGRSGRRAPLQHQAVPSPRRAICGCVRPATT